MFSSTMGVPCGPGIPELFAALSFFHHFVQRLFLHWPTEKWSRYSCELVSKYFENSHMQPGLGSDPKILLTQITTLCTPNG